MRTVLLLLLWGSTALAAPLDAGRKLPDILPSVKAGKLKVTSGQVTDRGYGLGGSFYEYRTLQVQGAKARTLEVQLQLYSKPNLRTVNRWQVGTKRTLLDPAAQKIHDLLLSDLVQTLSRSCFGATLQEMKTLLSQVRALQANHQKVPVNSTFNEEATLGKFTVYLENTPDGWLWVGMSSSKITSGKHCVLPRS